MADYGDFKEPTPGETFSMPPRDPSLDDFEKLENYCIQEKPENGSQVKQDFQEPIKTHEAVDNLLGSFDSKMSQPFDDYIKPTKYETMEDDFKSKTTSSSAHDDPYADLLGFGSSSYKAPQVNTTSSLQDFDIRASETVSNVSAALPEEEDDDFESGFGADQKLVHPQQEAPSDSGYELGPSDEIAVSKEPPVVETHFDKTVPSAPEIAHHVFAADPLVSGQQTRRSPTPPPEIPPPSEIPKPKAAAPSPAPTNLPRKMSSDDVSSTKPEGTPGCPFSPSALFDPKRLNPYVTQLVYWQDPKKSGGVFGSLLLLLLSLRFFSLISVASYLALGLLSVTLSFRIYKNILQAVQKSNDGHPFKEYLEYDFNVPQEKLHETADTLVKHVNCTAQKLRSLFLVEDLVDSIKLGIVLWTLTYLGAWFNGLTLIILGVIAVFTLPKLYESNQTVVDQYLSLAGAQVSGVLTVVKSKIPFGKKEKSQ